MTNEAIFLQLTSEVCLIFLFYEPYYRKRTFKSIEKNEEFKGFSSIIRNTGISKVISSCHMLKHSL
jgi:hypothetical protein